jgi:hypothetical protein
MGGVANCTRHRETGNRHRLASSGLPPVLDWKSRSHVGRPPLPADVRALIRTMSEANTFWGAPRIHGELLKLGIDVSQATVAKYMIRHRQPPSQTWRTFLRNHIGQIAAADFFVVPTATCRLLFVLVILAHERRRVVHMGVTDHRPRRGPRNSSARRSRGTTRHTIWRGGKNIVSRPLPPCAGRRRIARQCP